MSGVKIGSKLYPLSTPFSRPLFLHTTSIYVHIYISTHSIRPCYATRTRTRTSLYHHITYEVTVTRRTQLYLYNERTKLFTTSEPWHSTRDSSSTRLEITRCPIISRSLHKSSRGDWFAEEKSSRRSRWNEDGRFSLLAHSPNERTNELHRDERTPPPPQRHGSSSLPQPRSNPRLITRGSHSLLLTRILDARSPLVCRIFSFLPPLDVSSR